MAPHDLVKEDNHLQVFLECNHLDLLSLDKVGHPLAPLILANLVLVKQGQHLEVAFLECHHSDLLSLALEVSHLSDNHNLVLAVAPKLHLMVFVGNLV